MGNLTFAPGAPEDGGGNITLIAGTGGGDHSRDNEPTDGGSIKFCLPGSEEYMRIEPNGDCFVKGSLVATDVEAYNGFVNWLKSAGFYL